MTTQLPRIDRSTTADPDADLLGRLRAGEESARASLFHRHRGRMLAVARRLLRSEADCADAVQDAFLSAFRSLASFAGQSSLGTWLHRIVVNACLMKRRARARRRDVSLDELWPAFDEMGHPTRRTAPRTDSAPTLLVRAELRASVRACIDRLPEPHRTVLLLRDIEELDTDEVAERLAISPGAVKTRLHRARQTLRALLEPVVLPEGDS
jgi:RNA polymerase sigma-70 factor (ECF subfamily)